jgi:hypothetical protein
VTPEPAATAAAPAADESLPAEPARSPAAVLALAPSPPDRPAADEFDVVLLAVPLDPEAEWVAASSAAPPAADWHDAYHDALFAQPEEPDAFPDLPGGEPNPILGAT